MQFTAHQIKNLLNGTIEGDPEVTVNQLAKIEEAEAGSLSFLANLRYEQHLYTTNASIVIINKDFVLAQPVKSTLIRVDNAYSAFSVLLEKYNSIRLDKSGIETPSFIHPTAKIGKNVYIGAFAYIEANVTIGDNCKIYPHVYIGDNTQLGDDCTLFSGVKIYHDCIIGDRVMIHASTVIGSDGFGFAPQPDGSYTKVSQIGNVIIENDVEIGSNTSIDRATMGSTIIRQGAKLDNLIQLAHNVEIGKNTVIASQTGISGSSKIGSGCILGGQVGIVGHVQVANNSQIQAQSGINSSLKEENKKWAGTPANLYINYMRAQVVLQRLPQLEKEIEKLQDKLNSINQEEK